MIYVGSNSEAAVCQHAERCVQALERGRAGGLQALNAYREAGRELSEMKKILPRGRFGREVEAHCSCTKQWAARLMKLHREWKDLQAAQEWAKNDGRTLSGKVFTVDGALGLVRAWRSALDGGCRPSRVASRAKKTVGTEFEHKLAAGRVYARYLEEELAAIRSATPDQPHQILEAQTKMKIDKIAALWLRGGTDGERFCAVTQLAGIARRLGWDLRALMRDSGLELKADFPFTPGSMP